MPADRQVNGRKRIGDGDWPVAIGVWLAMMKGAILTSRKICAAVGGLLLGSVCAICLVSWPSAAQDTKLPFAVGEKLRFAVRWRLVPAGEAELFLGKEETAPGRWKATAKANSIGYVSNLYKVDDEYQSTFRNPAFCSNEIRKVINEGDRHREISLFFDLRRHLALMRDRETRPNPQPPRQVQSSIPNCVHDIISAFYYTRSQPLAVGQSFEVAINDGIRTIPLRIEVQAKEEIQTPIGKFEATRVEPDVFSGNLFKEKGRMFVWFSDDASRLPVQMKAQMGIGTITASLAAVEHVDANP